MGPRWVRVGPDPPTNGSSYSSHGTAASCSPLDRRLQRHSATAPSQALPSTSASRRCVGVARNRQDLAGLTGTSPTRPCLRIRRYVELSLARSFSRQGMRASRRGDTAPLHPHPSSLTQTASQASRKRRTNRPRWRRCRCRLQRGGCRHGVLLRTGSPAWEGGRGGWAV